MAILKKLEDIALALIATTAHDTHSDSRMMLIWYSVNFMLGQKSDSGKVTPQRSTRLAFVNGRVSIPVRTYPGGG